MWKKWLNVYFTYLLISVYMFVRGEISPSTYARRETSLVAWMCRLQFFPFSLSIHFRKYSFLWDNNHFLGTTIYSSMQWYWQMTGLLIRVIWHTCRIYMCDMIDLYCAIFVTQSPVVCFCFSNCVFLCVPFRFSFSLLYLCSLVLHPETRASSERPNAIYCNMHSRACVLCVYQ